MPAEDIFYWSLLLCSSGCPDKHHPMVINGLDVLTISYLMLYASFLVEMVEHYQDMTFQCRLLNLSRYTFIFSIITWHYPLFRLLLTAY